MVRRGGSSHGFVWSGLAGWGPARLRHTGVVIGWDNAWMNNGGAAEDVLSASSLSSFRRCPQQWYFSHVEKIRMMPSIKQKLGIAVHAGVEHNYRQKLLTREDEPVSDTLDHYSTVYDNEILEVEKPDEDAGKAKDQGVKLTQLYQVGGWGYKAIAPDIQPLWVERQTTFRVISDHVEDCDRGPSCSCGVPFSATIDLVDEARQVRDTKTTARSPSGGQHLMQVASGAIGFEAETGEQASDLVIDTLVRTKTPKYVQERWGGPVDKPMRKVFAQQVNIASSMIQQGLFPASGAEAGQGGPCSWCGYKPICPVWAKRK